MKREAEALPDPLHLVLPSEHAVLERVVEEVEAYVGARFPDDEFVYRVVLLATEAVTNAVEHGNRLAPDKKVVLDVYTSADGVTMSVMDEGGGFDPDAVQNPLSDENLLREGGRGIYLIESMADAVRYELGGRRLVVELYT